LISGVNDREKSGRDDRTLAWGEDMEDSSRRKFLGSCLGGIALAAAGAAAYPLYRYLAPRPAGSTEQKITIPANEVPAGGAKFFEFNGATAVVVRKQDGRLIALSAVCTHLGCIVQWQRDKEQFLCPCHAGLYTAEGTVVSGPPPKPLARLPFTVTGDVITVG
jgi:cytochrome b6-f complex iron-sulfur subunit